VDRLAETRTESASIILCILLRTESSSRKEERARKKKQQTHRRVLCPRRNPRDRGGHRRGAEKFRGGKEKAFVVLFLRNTSRIGPSPGDLLGGVEVEAKGREKGKKWVHSLSCPGKEGVLKTSHT